MRHAGFKSQQALSLASGIPQPTISRVLKGSIPEVGTLKKLSAACEVPFEWLAEGSGKSSVIRAIDESAPSFDTHKIRRVKFRVEAGISGFSICQEQDEGNPIYFRKDWLKMRNYKPDKLIAVYVHGDSMEPGLYNGDTVIVNTADKDPKDGDVFVVNYESETIIKRLIRDTGSWWLSSDNPDQRRFPRKECTDSLCKIIGRVVHKQSERI